MKNSGGIAIFSGAGLGVAVGLFMGLTVSPVVGVVIGAITSSLALFLGFGEGNHSREKSLRIGAFGLAAAASSLLGLYIRSHEMLAPSVNEIYDSYKSIGFSDEEARAFVRYKKLGILDSTWVMAFDSGDSSSVGADIIPKGVSNLLFGKTVNPTSCEVFTISEGSSLTDIKSDFDLAGDEGWNAAYKAVIETFPRSNQKDVLVFMVSQVCKYPNLECSGLSTFKSNPSLNAMAGIMANAGNEWGSIYEASAQFADDEIRRKVLLLFKKSVCDED